MAAHNWRIMRARFLTYGITRPLEQLSSMHAVLDLAELVLFEACTKDEEREELQAKLYRPETRLRLTAMDDEDDDTPPPGFSPEELNATFDSFVARAR